MKVNINYITRGVSKLLLKTKKHSPEILVIAGAVGAVTSAVMACKATLKVNDILDETKETVEKIHHVSETRDVTVYSEEDCKKDLTITYIQTGIKLVKLYAPSVILGTLSIGAMMYSNRILSKRNIALAAAYATVDKGFKDYRKNVIERFGEKIDHELKHNIKAKVIEAVEIDENGDVKTVKEEVNICNEPSEYARFFDEMSRYYEKNAEYNLKFLKDQERYANEKLRRKGFLFLNEVYEMLDIPETKAGQIVGWVYNKDSENLPDGYVDFGIYDINRPKNREFVNGYERAILLDFNVDGNILDLI